MSMSDKTIYIYGVIDINSSPDVIYVGKTNNLKTRKHQHSRKHAEEGRYTGHKPQIKLCILEVVPPGKDWAEAELYWINYGIREGWKLTNSGVYHEHVITYPIRQLDYLSLEKMIEFSEKERYLQWMSQNLTIKQLKDVMHHYSPNRSYSPDRWRLQNDWADNDFPEPPKQT